MYLRGMSDWSLAELEDIDWSVFGRTDDHIVPHGNVQLLDESSASNVAHKKPQHEVKNDLEKKMWSRGCSNKTVFWREEDAYYLPMKNGNSSILEGSQSHTSNVVVPTFCGLEGTANGSALLSQDGRILDYCVSDSDTDAKSSIFCSTDSSLATMVLTNNGKFCIPLHKNATPDVTSLSFHEGHHQDRDNELAYYDWPDVGNFEDIDKLLRNWDTTISQGQTGTADEPSWFSSYSNTLYGLENALEPDLQSSNSDFGAQHAKLGYHRTNCNFFPKTFPAADHDKPTCSKYAKYTEWLSTDAPSTAKTVGKVKLCNEGDDEKITEPTQITNEYSLNESGASVKIESHKSLVDKGTKRSRDQMLLDSDLSAPKMHSSQQLSQQKHFVEPSSSSFVQDLDPHSQLEFGLSTKQVPFTHINANVEFEKGTNPSSSYQVSDDIMNHSSQCLDRFAGRLYLPQVMTLEQNLEKLYQSERLSSTATIDHLHHQPAFRSKASVRKNVLESIDDPEMEDVSLELPTVEIDHPVMQDSPDMISVSSDDSSEKVTSFQQLQDVMHQLDVKTKLCIRDSLYRLARSASQRSGFVTENHIQGITDSKGIQGAEALKRSAEFMDAETTTNPIDRSIAYLLLQKPSEPTTRPAKDTTLESPIMVMSPDQVEHQMTFGACGVMEIGLP